MKSSVCAMIVMIGLANPAKAYKCACIDPGSRNNTESNTHVLVLRRTQGGDKVLHTYTSTHSNRYLVVYGQKRDQANSSSGIVSKTLISSAEGDPIIGVMLTLSLFC